MTLFKNKYRVETTRLRGWDYSADGYYFVTICVKTREHLFGEIVNGQMIINPYGAIVEQCWFDLPNHYRNLKLDAFCVMPDHIHCIVVIDNGDDGGIGNNCDDINGNDVVDTGDGVVVDTGLKPVSTTTLPTIPLSTTPKRHGLFEFIRALKTFSARRINALRNSVGEPVWQSRFHDHIIRDNLSLERIRTYITNNPQTWNHDKLNKF